MSYFILISLLPKFPNIILASWIDTELINSHYIKLYFLVRYNRYIPYVLSLPPHATPLVFIKFLHLCLFNFYWPPAPLPGKLSTRNKKKLPQLLNTTANTPCLPAPSAHASYKGYGCNNAKPPRPPHRNTMIDFVVFGCGPIRTGEGAAAPFIGVHNLGENRLAGGFDTLAKLRWEDQIGPSIPVQKIKHTTIYHRGLLNVRRIGRGMERWPCLWRRKLGGIFDA
jgi:hypothetical protein